MPRARSTWECLRSKTGFTNRWKYSPFFFGLRNFLSLLASQCLTSPLVLVASVQYIVCGDNLSLCIVIAHHIGVHVEDCHQTSALLMVAITQTDYHPFVVAVLARMEFHYGTFGKRLFGKQTVPGDSGVIKRPAACNQPAAQSGAKLLELESRHGDELRQMIQDAL